MEDKDNFQTYLYISEKNLIISVRDNFDKKNYEKKILFQQNLNYLDLEILNNFLNDNVYKIEKSINDFVKKIFIIIDLNIFFKVDISIKKENNENLINLKYLLNEAKDSCKKTIDDRKIIHMVINSYLINDVQHSTLPKDLTCQNFSLDIKFICLPNIFVKNLEDILKSYQISLGKIISAQYLYEFQSKDENDLFLTSKRIVRGNNPNEVILVDKSPKKLGFFEKFFNFFS